MVKKITVTGARPKQVQIVDQPKRRIDPVVLAEVMGAKLADPHRVPDAISLAEVGARLLARLRSTGGRPALVDATVICRVPLTATEVAELESMAARLSEATGARPSVGQLASIIVGLHLSGPKK